MNIVSIRQKVERAIKKAPLQLTILRDVYIDDGCGGYLPNPETPTVTVGQIEAILDNSKSGKPRRAVTEAGEIQYSESPVLLTIWRQGMDFQRGDYFTLSGRTYYIDNPVNVLELNIYWQLSLRQTDEVELLHTPEPTKERKVVRPWG